MGTVSNMEKSNGKQNVEKNGNFDYSNNEVEFKNIPLQGSIFTAKWQKEKGYSVGIVDTRLTEDYETLNEALEIVGLEAYTDKDGEEVFKQSGIVDYDLISRIVITLIEQFNKVNVKQND